MIIKALLMVTYNPGNAFSFLSSRFGNNCLS